MKNKDNKQNSKILINGSYSILLTVLLLHPNRCGAHGQMPHILHGYLT